MSWFCDWATWLFDKINNMLIDLTDHRIEIVEENGKCCSLCDYYHNLTYLEQLVLSTKNNPDALSLLESELKVACSDVKNLNNNSGLNLLMLAVKNTHTLSTPETVKLLLRYGADVNAQSPHGYTALMYALEHFSESQDNLTIKYLIGSKNMNYNLQNHWGETALMFAAEYFNEIIDSDSISHIYYNSFYGIRDKFNCGFLAKAIKKSRHDSHYKFIKMATKTYQVSVDDMKKAINNGLTNKKTLELLNKNYLENNSSKYDLFEYCLQNNLWDVIHIVVPNADPVIFSLVNSHNVPYNTKIKIFNVMKSLVEKKLEC